MKRRLIKAVSMFMAMTITLTSVDITAFAASETGAVTDEATDGTADGTDLEIESGLPANIPATDGQSEFSDGTSDDGSASEPAEAGSTVSDKIVSDEPDDSEGEDLSQDEVSDDDFGLKPVVESADILYSGSWAYYLDEDGLAHIIGYTDGSVSELKIPVRISGNYVVSIEDAAFSELSSLSTVTVPFYVAHIGEDAFPESVTIKAYHGSAALEYAADYGYDCVNRSELDFADGVHDLSEIIRADYSLLSPTDIEMYHVEASLLSVGDVFYLPPSEEIPNGDGFRVCSVEADGDWWILHCERALGADILNTLVIHEQDLKPDWSRAVYLFDTNLDGQFETFEAEDVEDEYGDVFLRSEPSALGDFKSDYSFEDGTLQAELNWNIDKKFSTTNKPDILPDDDLNSAIAGVIDKANTFPQSECSGKFEASLSISVTPTLSLDVDADLSGNKLNQFEPTLNITESIEGSAEASGSVEIPLVVVPFVSTGLANIYFMVSFDADGKASTTLSYTCTQSFQYEYVNGRMQCVHNDKNSQLVAEYSAELNVGIRAGIYLETFADAIGGELSAYVGLEAKAGVTDTDVTASGDTFDAYFKVDLVVTWHYNISVIGVDDLLDGPPNNELFRKTLFDKKWDHPGKLYTVLFKTSNEVLGRVTVEEGKTIEEPTDLIETDENVVLGWYKKNPAQNTVTDADKWDFEKDTVTKDDVDENGFLTLYPKYDGKCLINFVAFYPGSKTPIENYIPARVVEKGTTGDDIQNLAGSRRGGKLKDYIILGYYEDEDFNTPWDKSRAINSDLTLYVKVAYGDAIYTVTIVDGYYGDAEGNYDNTKNTFHELGRHELLKSPNAYIYVDEIHDLGEYPGYSAIGNIYKRTKWPGEATPTWKLWDNYDTHEGTDCVKDADTTLYRTFIPTRLKDDSSTTNNLYDDYNGSASQTGSGRVSLGSSGNTCTLTKWTNYDGDECCVIPYAVVKDGVEYTVREIAEGAVRDLHVKYVFIPDTVRIIRKGAFNCNNLESVYIPYGVDIIEDRAFVSSALGDHLTSVTAPGTPYEMHNKFSYFYSVEEYEISEGTPYETLSSTNGLKNPQGKIRTLIIPGSVKSIGRLGEFPSLETIVLGDGVESIDDSAFYSCSSLAYISIPESVRTIGQFAFSGCTALSDITIPEGVTSLGRSAFQGCDGLTDITLPNSVTSVDESVFAFCDNLTSVCISADLTSIPESCFSHCANLSEVNLPKGVKSVGKGAFSSCENLTDIVFPSGLEDIGDYAFIRCKTLESVEIPNSVTHIGQSAFDDCVNLKSVSLSGSLDAIENNTFYGCDSLTSVRIPEGVQSIGEDAFGQCDSLVSVTIFNSVKSIGGGAFSWCKSLRQITIPNSVETIGDGVFSGCTALFSVSLSSGIHSIPKLAFSSCNLSEIHIPDGVTEIGEHAFESCRALRSVSLPDSVTVIGDGAFLMCDSLSSVSLSQGLESIGDQAFISCTSLTQIVIPASTVYLGESSFASSGLERVVFSEGTPGAEPVLDISRYAFRDCGHLSSVALSGRVRSIGDYVFSGCNLISVSIPASVQTLGDETLDTGLSKAYILTNNVPNTWSRSAFTDSSSVTLYGGYGVWTYAQSAGCKWEYATADAADIKFVSGQDEAPVQTSGFAGQTIDTSYTPARDGYTFGGWYIDEGYTEAWNSEIDVLPPTGVTLYAKWVRDGDVAVGGFVTEESSGTVTITGYVGAEASIVVPSEIEGKTVTGIGKYAFCADEYVSTISIPASVTSIDEHAFDSLPRLYSISVDPSNEVYSSEGGVLFDKTQTELIRYPAAKQDTSYTVPPTVTRISAFAFTDATALKTLALPESIEEIGILAFWRCRGLKLTGPVGHAVISAYAGNYGIDYNRHEVHFISGDDTVLSVDEEAGRVIRATSFERVSGLMKDSYSFAGWHIGNATGEEWNGSTDLMPDEDLNLYAAWTCDYTYTMDGDNVTITGVTNASTDIIIPETLDSHPVTAIAAGAFADTGISSVTVPACVTDIAAGAIHGDATVIADSDSAAATYASSEGLSFKARKYALYYEANNGTSRVVYYKAKGDSVNSFPAPIRDNYTQTGWYTDEALTQEFDIDTDVMPGAPMTLYAGWSKVDASIPDIELTFVKDGTDIVITGYTGHAKSVSIPATINGNAVRRIEDRAFYDNDLISEVIIPDSVTSIGERAFADCDMLMNLTLGSGLTTVGEMAFSDDPYLRSVDLSGSTSLTQIPAGCFMYDKYLSELTLPAGLVSIGDRAFAGCPVLDPVTLPDTLDTVGSLAFSMDSSLSSLSIPATVTSLGTGFADGCGSLAELTIDEQNQVYSIRNGLLYCGQTLIRCPEGYEGQITMAGDTTAIEAEAFRNCRNITSVVIPDSVTTIGDGAFAGCTSLESVGISDTTGLSAISDRLFAGCSALTDVMIPAHITSLGSMSFMGCHALETLTVGRSVTTIGKSVFFGDRSLTVRGYADSAIDRYMSATDEANFEYITSGAYDAPAAPVASEVDHTTVTLTPVEGCEYRYTDGEWQSSNVFSGLDPVRTYVFQQRKKATAQKDASEPSTGTSVTTGKRAGIRSKAPVVMRYTDSSITIAAVSGAEYSIDGINWQTGLSFSKLTPSTTYMIYQRIAETDISEAGAVASAEVTTLAYTGPCDVTYDAHGGTMSDGKATMVTTVTGGTKIAQAPTAVRTGYTLSGWYKDEDCRDKWIFESMAVPGNMTLYAGWTPNHYTIVFDANEASVDGEITGAMDNLSCVYGNEYILPDNAYTHEYYSFTGWNTSPDGTGVRIPDGATVSDLTGEDGATVTLYAQWRDMRPAAPVAYPDPEAGALDETSRISFVTDTDDAEIYYRVGDGDETVYAEAFILTTDMPHTTEGKENVYTVTVYASVGGAKSAVKTYVYHVTDPSLDWGDMDDPENADVKTALEEAGKTPADIPAGLWLHGVSDHAYTGTAITQSGMKVFFGKKELVYGDDYTVKYTNNTKAGLATVTITGKGNYAGSIVRNFTITPLDLGSVTLGVDGADHVIISDGSNDASLTIPDIYLTHNGRMQKGTTTVMYDVPQDGAPAKTVTLKAGTDFTYFYPQTDKKGDPTTYDATAFVGFKDKTSTPGECGYTEYTVMITGKGNFSGTAAFTERIYAKDDTSTIHVSRLNVASIPAQTLTYDTDGSVKGAAPELTVKDTTVRGVTTVLDELSGRNDILPTDDGYTLTWLNNEAAGTATVVITGHGKYVGSRTATFKINGLAMTKVSVDTAAMSEINRKNGFAYTGSPIRWEEPDPNDPTAEPDKYYTLTYVASRGASPVGLVEGRDYDVTYSNNVNAGRNRATITFTGKGIYIGSIKRTYTITTVPLATKQGNTVTENADIAVTMADSYTYTKGGVKPEPVVTYNGEVLNAGTDYTLKYTNNNSINTRTDNGDGTYTWKDSRRIPAVTITGKGNFTGALTRVFAILPSSLEGSGVTMTAADVVYSNKAGNCRTTVTLTDSNGTKLAAGSDYDKSFTYTYVNDTSVKIKDGRNVVDDPTLRPAGTEADMNRDYVQPGTLIRVTVTAARKGAYSGLADPNDMTTEPSSISKTFRVIGADIGRASVKVADQIYTGRPIELFKYATDATGRTVTDAGGHPVDNPDITITLNRVTLTSSDYEIVPGSYRNNTNKGTATFTIHGLGNYGGTRTVTFKIVNRSMNMKVSYDGNADYVHGEQLAPIGGAAVGVTPYPTTASVTGRMNAASIASGGRLARNSYKLPGFTFMGWNTMPDGTGQSFEPGGVFIPSDMTLDLVGGYGSNTPLVLYAQWLPDAYKLTYRTNGGTNDMSNPAVFTAYNTVTIEASVRAGYTFAGWYYDSRCTSKPLDSYERTLEDGTSVITCTIPTGTTGNKTIYAKWIRQ